MYCIQVNKLLEKTKNPKSKKNLYVVLGYGNQKRRTTCRPPHQSDIHIWYESFIFVIDNDITKNIKMEIFDRNKSIASETIQINRTKMIHKNTKFLDIQHGLINYETESKNKKLERENESLGNTQIKLMQNIENLSNDLANMKMLVQNITDLIQNDGIAYE